MKNLALLTALALWVACLGGCASFRGDRLGPVSAPTPPTWKPSVSLVVSGEAAVNEVERDLPAAAIEFYREQAQKSYEASGYFSKVTLGLEESDLRAEVQILDRGVVSQAGSFFTGLTLFLVPSKATDVFTVETAFVGADGETIGSFERTEEMNTWIQLFLIFFTPFNWPQGVGAEILRDLNTAVLFDAVAAGVFAQPDPGGSEP